MALAAACAPCLNWSPIVASWPVIGPTTEMVMSSAKATDALIIKPNAAALKIPNLFMAIELLHLCATGPAALVPESRDNFTLRRNCREDSVSGFGSFLRGLLGPSRHETALRDRKNAKARAGLVPAGRGFCNRASLAPPAPEPARFPVFRA